jgi:Alpha-galactosidase, CBM13 domain
VKKRIDSSLKANVLRNALILISLVTFNREMFCQTPSPTATPSPTPTPTAVCARPTPGTCVRYEAESDNNTLGGSAFVLDCPTCSNQKKVGYIGSNDGTLQFNGVGVVATGNYTVTICYLNGDAVRYAYLSVNGGPGMPLSFPSTGSFQTLGSIQITVALNTGCNTLEFYNPILGDWAPDFDVITFNCSTCAVPTPTATPPPPTPIPTPTATPSPEGCYPNFTTAEGCDALLSLTTGSGNTALGWGALVVDTIGNFNTGAGSGALALNTMDSNTAVGAAALLLNSRGTQNTALGTDALVFNGSGDVSGDGNTAIGYFALMNNVTGGSNTAIGWEALAANVDAANNVAIGSLSLSTNASGINNTAIGSLALDNCVSTNRHVMVGKGAGSGITIADYNIIVGHHSGVHSRFGQENNVCYIGNIYGANVDNADGVAKIVWVDPDGRLGTHPTPAPVGGNPGKSRGIQPQAIPDAAKEAMLDLEVQSLEATISQQQQQIEILTARIKEQIEQIQKVNARVEMNKPAAKIIVNRSNRPFENGVFSMFGVPRLRGSEVKPPEGGTPSQVPSVFQQSPEAVP